MFEVIGIIAGILAAVSYFPYAYDILRKKAKPERASWFIWVVLFSIVFFAQLFQGATSSLWFTLFDGIGALMIFILSIKYGVGGLARRDIIGLIAAAIGVVLWYFTKEPLYALLISIGIDTIAATLTVLKTLESPHTETYFMWGLVATAAILGMISVGRLDFELLVYPFYIFLANFSVVVAKFWGERTQRA